MRTAAWEALGGLAEEFFLYYDDVDFALRLQIAGCRVVFQPAAIVEHDYDFDKGDLKWFYLERNRAWSIATVPSTRTLLLLAPLLAASEIGLLARAIREGWWRQKLRAWRSVLSNFAAIEQRRRVVQATRTNSDRDWAQLMKPPRERNALRQQFRTSTNQRSGCSKRIITEGFDLQPRNFSLNVVR